MPPCHLKRVKELITNNLIIPQNMIKINPPAGGKNRPKIIVILGPTASGKSDLGIKMARKFNGEIISADSRQVYKGMDIGTGKVTKKEQLLARHHLLNVVRPGKIFTVSDFKKLGEKSVKTILNRKKIPLIVGGTGFYIDALVKDTSLPEVPPDKKLRSKLEKIPAEKLYQQLKKSDPKRAGSIDKHNKRRLIRALEIIRATGKPVPATKETLKYKILCIGINPPRKILEKKIALRLKSRLRQGMVSEVRNLLKAGVGKKRLYDFGLEYRWIGNYLNNAITRQQMEAGLLRDIIKYSKRQMTWFKKNKEIHWLNSPAGRQKEAEKLIRKFLASPL